MVPKAGTTMTSELRRREMRDAQREFGDTYMRYAAMTPRWVPHLGGRSAADAR